MKRCRKLGEYDIENFAIPVSPPAHYCVKFVFPVYCSKITISVHQSDCDCPYKRLATATGKEGKEIKTHCGAEKALCRFCAVFNC
jgi:hypothetical protein